jgi:hypothetical protein
VTAAAGAGGPLALAGLPADPADPVDVATTHAGTVVAVFPGEGDRDLQATDVTPGVLGFAVMFGVALLVIVIAMAMTRSLRRVNHRRSPDDEDPAGGHEGPPHPDGSGADGGRG